MRICLPELSPLLLKSMIQVIVRLSTLREIERSISQSGQEMSRMIQEEREGGRKEVPRARAMLFKHLIVARRSRARAISARAICLI